MQAGADMVESAFSAGQIGFGYDMGAVAEAENSKVDAGHSLEVRMFVEDASPFRDACWSSHTLLARLPLAASTDWLWYRMQ